MLRAVADKLPDLRRSGLVAQRVLDQAVCCGDVVLSCIVLDAGLVRVNMRGKLGDLVDHRVGLVLST